MMKFYSRILVLFLLVFAQLSGHGQVAAYTFAQTTGTYTAITGGTVLGVPTGNGTLALDDTNYPLATGSFPFTFTFNGTGYTGCTVNTNGYITFGTTTPSTSGYTPISAATAYAGAVSALGMDLNTVYQVGASSATGELRWQVVGSAPNREVVIQWTKFRAYSTSTTNAYTMDFQIRLAETSNTVKVVYGNPGYLVGSTAVSASPQVGLRGATSADYNNRTNSTSVLFTASTAGSSNTATQAYNSNTTPPGVPSNGLTYTWTPPSTPPVDLTFVSIGGLPTPPCPTGSAAITATIKNTGLNTLNFATTPATVTVNITGANAQSLTATVNSGTLAPNATQVVTLTPNANFSNGGNNTLNGTVSISGDGIAANNTATATVSLVPTTSTFPITVDFTGFTGSNLSTVFPLWSEGAGATTPTGTTSTWTSTTGVGGASNTTAKVNLYNTAHNEWIIGPRFAAATGTILQFDVAVTAFATTATASAMGSDDRVSVMVSTDCGVTWTEVRAFTVADNLTTSLVTKSVNLGTTYAGQNIMVAFKATDGTVDDAEDYDFHLDNIMIGQTCSGLPSGGTAVATPGFACYGGTVVLSATGASTGLGITYQWQSAPVASSTWTDIPGATSATYTATLLTAMQYRLKVTCTASNFSDFSSSIVASVTNGPTYTSVPFTESFENWVNGCGTTDRPGVNWGASPSTGDNSWRREDQGSSASWSSSSGLYSPVFTDGAHSARFHSYDAASGTTGSLDLFINMSTPTGTKYLRFDYINTSGSDVLKVLVSTDGGQTFTQVGSTLAVQSAWATKEFTIASNSATTIIRLQATSDFGTTDIGVDNLQVIPGCTGAPTAGTASATTACYGGSSTLSLTGTTSGGGITYQWQSSPDGTTWTNITGATGSTYTVTLVTNTSMQYRAVVTCTPSSQSANSNAVTIPFSNTPTYAPVPYTQGFESWINACGTTDRPDASWGLLPNTSDSSWRRDDQGASANWTSTNGAYTPVFSQGAHSARFHSYNTPAGRTGSMDLFVNMSASSQDKLLKFDYLNTIGTDSLVILFSSNGGQTFTRLDSLTIRAAWTTKQIIIPSNTATGVIRFKAYSDFGNGAADLGIDNVQVLVGCTGAPTPGTVNIVSNTPVCLGNTVSLSLSGQTAAAGITYQWQSSADNSTWTNISGATSSTYTATPTGDTYYRVVVTCTNTSQSANTPGVLVTVSNPMVTSTTPGVRCGIGPVTLSATGSAGTTLNWYTAASGGNLAWVGNTFTTPPISATTTYYVSALKSNGFVNVTIGAGASTSSSYESPYYHLYGGKKSQYLILASELTSAGITGGGMTSIAFNVVAAGTTYNNFNISMGTTSATAMTTTLQTGLVNVYSAASVTPVVGLNTYNFNGAFNWDGSSNIIVEVCWSNNNTGGAGATVKMDATSFVSHAYYRADSQTPAAICGTTTATNTNSLRPQMIFNAQSGCASPRVAVQATVTTPPAITLLPNSVAICAGQSATLAVTSPNAGYTYSWTPGALTGTPVSVTPAATTKYVVTATDNSAGPNNGCVNKDSLIVTVNPLPTPITLTPASAAICLNSIQPLTVSGGLATGSLTLSSASAINLAIPDNSATGIFDSLIVAGIPTGATIDSVIVTYSITHTFAADVEVNLQAPNGQVVNLMADEGSFSGLGFTNTRVSSNTSQPAFSTGSNPFTGTYRADLAAQTDLIGPISTQTFSDLFATPNGTWKIRVYDDASVDVGNLVNWSLKIAYTAPASFTWSPATGLYTDANATTPYVANTPATTVYAKPTGTTTYTVTATNGSGCTRTATSTVTVNTAPAITGQPVSQIGCTGGTIVFRVTATGSGLTYQWRKNGTNISGATSATLTLSNVTSADNGSYDVIVSGTCPSPVTSNAATLVVGDDSWTGVSNSDWNNPLNWCNGVPGLSTNVLIPGGTPFSPIITNNASAADIVVNTGASLTVTSSGRLLLSGNLTTNGTFNATAGTIEFRGASNQNIPALTVASVFLNGSGGVTLGGALNITTALTLTNGNITLGANNLTMTGGTVGSLASHIITNGTGTVTNTNVTVASVVFPVAPNASSYNPVMIANGQGRNYTVSVAVGVTPTILNPARAVNRTWNISANTAPTSPVNITLQYADGDVNANATPTANMEAGVYTGNAWLTVSPAGGVPPTGTASGRVVGFQTVVLGPTVLANAGGLTTPTAVANIDADVTSAVLMPNRVENNTVLRIHVRRTMKITWNVVDANGRVVYVLSRQVFAGQNDIPLSLGHLASGTYQLVGRTDRGQVPPLRLVRL